MKISYAIMEGYALETADKPANFKAQFSMGRSERYYSTIIFQLPIRI